MKREEIFGAIKEHLEERGHAPEEIVMESRFREDLQLDSLDTTEFTLSMEERFAINIPDEEIEKLETLGDAVDLVERTLAVSA